MPINRQTFSRYRPRFVTLLLLIVIAALLVLANLSDEIGPRHQEASQSPADLRFDARQRDDRYRGSENAPLFNVSYGWPLLWRQYVIELGWTGAKVHGDYYGKSRLLGNLMMWLAILAAPTAICEWLLRRFRPRLRWSLRTMLATIGLVAVLCGWLAAARKRAETQEALIAAIAQNHGNVWVERAGPKWLDLVGGGRYRQYITGVRFGYDAEWLERGGVFKRLGQSPNLRYLEAKCLTPGLVDALQSTRRIRSLSIEWLNQLGDNEDQSVWHDCLAAIGQMTQLEHLRLYADQEFIANQSLANLAGLANLRSFGFNAAYTDESSLLEHLPPLPNLEVIDLTGSQIGNHDLRHLAALPHLKSIILTDTNVTGTGLADLGASESLEELCIGADAVSAAGLESLFAIKHLKKLHIVGVPFLRLFRAELALDHGHTTFVPRGDLEGCQQALEELRRSRPGFVVDDECPSHDWPSKMMAALGNENGRNSIDEAVHQALREWKEQNGANVGLQPAPQPGAAF